MKSAIKTIIFILLTVLIFTNIYIFMVGIRSSNDLTRMETDLAKLKQENIELENKLSYFDSLEYASSVAASLNFDQKAIPTYLDSLKYALNR